MPDANWVADGGGYPPHQDLVRRRSGDGSTWVVLQGGSTWDSRVPDYEDAYESRHRHFWIHQYSWLTQAGDAAKLVRSLSQRHLSEIHLAENADLTNSAYLGEAPWAASAKEYPPEWQPFDNATEISVLATDIQYTWTSGENDSTLEESVNVTLPVYELWLDTELSWVPGTQSWANGEEVQIRFERWSDGTESHRALLVRESWLEHILDRQQLELVSAVHGERIMTGGDVVGLPEGWNETTGISSLRDGTWRHGTLRNRLHSPVN